MGEVSKSVNNKPYAELISVNVCTQSIRGAVQKKRDFLGIFPKEGEWVFSIPKTFVK